MITTYADAVARARAHQGPLNERLAILTEANRTLFPHYHAAIERLVARLRQVKAGQGAPAVGEPLPDFMLPDQSGHIVRLDRLRASGPVVVALHRGVWCSFCRLTAAALASLQPRISELGGTLVGISPQRASHAVRHLADAQASFPMLSDVGGGYAASLGLTIPVGEDLGKALRQLGIDLAGINGDEGELLPIPATFVVDRNGVVTGRFVDPDHRRRMETEAIAQAVAVAVAAGH